MDVPRASPAKKLRALRGVLVAVGIASLVLVTVGLSRLEPAAPKVDRESVVVDTVRRGEFVRRVRAPGALVPEESRVISAATEGHVEEIVLLPGAAVTADSIILELSNPEVEQELIEAEAALRAAEADYTRLEAELESETLNQMVSAASLEAQYEQAVLRNEADRRLAEEGLVAELEYELSTVRVQELSRRRDLEQQRMARRVELAEAQLSAERARLHQAQAVHRLQSELADSLRLRAGIEGVLQRVDVEKGQRFAAGTALARVAQQSRLKAELRVPETQVKDVRLSQPVAVDTRNGIVEGRVERIDPGVQRGTVIVDVELVGPLPDGARPDLSVEGTIEIERLEGVLHVGRPAYGQSGATISLFKLQSDGKTANAVPVRLGRSSVREVEIIDGLEEGDTVVLSDMAAWERFDRVRVH